MSKKTTIDELRAKWTELVEAWVNDLGEEALRTGTNEVCIPVVDGENEEQYVVFTIKVPTGSRDGEPYDGYAMALDYKMKQDAKKLKAERAAEEKARKIARDTEMRRQKAEAKAKREERD